MTQLKANKIFNPGGDDEIKNRSIIKGNSTGLFQLNKKKYSWASSLYNIMIWNFWIPEKISGLNKDAIQFKTGLSKDEQQAYNGILSFLIFLDSIQTVNLPNFNNYITAPEVNLVLSIQTYQEAIHSQSYATILESVADAKGRDEVYYFWRTDKHLLKRNEFIGWIYQDFIDNPTDETFFKGIVWNFLLEGIYFYNGFAFFDTLASKGKMVATDRMISYIRRDELTHVTLFAHILREIKKEFPEAYSEKTIREMTETAVNQEIEWSKHILGKTVIGMSPKNIEGYTKWLANKRLTMLGIKPLYSGFSENPYKHLELLQNSNSEKSNFFESSVSNYTQSSSIKGSWDF